MFKHVQAQGRATGQIIWTNRNQPYLEQFVQYMHEVAREANDPEIVRVSDDEDPFSMTNPQNTPNKHATVRALTSKMC